MSQAFINLKKQVVGTVLNGTMANFLEIMRIATITVAKLPYGVRKEGIEMARNIFEKSFRELQKECEKLTKKAKSV